MLLVVEDGCWDGALVSLLFPFSRIRRELLTSVDAGVARLNGATAVLLHLRDCGLETGLTRGFGDFATANPKIPWFNIDVRIKSRVDLERILRCAGLRTTILSEAPATLDSLVIVKSRLNYGRLESGADGDTPSTLLRRICVRNYPVLRAVEVPDAVWRDRRLVVERYVTNLAGRFWRVFYMFGQVIVCEGRSDRQVKEVDSNSLRAAYCPVDGIAKRIADATRVVAREAKLDYGALDFVEDQNEHVYCIDVNLSPHFTEWGQSAREPLLDLLRLSAVTGLRESIKAVTQHRRT
jgi:hypothetical protein